jgi:protein-S-isoprenylcysteine O-methyltransferase Ste14
MRAWHALAALFLFVELPVPLYWVILHPLNPIWRRRVRAAFWVAGLTAWTVGGVLLWIFHPWLLESRPRSALFVIPGLVLIGVEVYLFWRVEHELGSRRLVGHAELTGTGHLFTEGLYAHIRHPRYTGMFCAVVGAALMAGTVWLWIVMAIWWPFALAVIRMEERELMLRFGSAYDEYRKRVPAFVPLRLRRR